VVECVDAELQAEIHDPFHGSKAGDGDIFPSPEAIYGGRDFGTGIAEVDFFHSLYFVIM
jgi:hypothetical protein